MDINTFEMNKYNCPWLVTGKHGSQICLASGGNCIFNECAVVYWILIHENKGDENDK